MASNKMTFAVETITPEIAKKYLALNIEDNRNILNTNIQREINDMENGRFFLTHQGIAFDTDGRLCDGQHRMKALSMCKPGTSIQILVARNVPKETFYVIDSGKARDDGFRMRQLTNNSQFYSSGGMALTNALIELYGYNPSTWSIERKYEFNKAHLALHTFFYNIHVRNRNSKGIMAVSYTQALVSALACGVSLKKILAFDDFANRQEITEGIQANWNIPASFYRWYIDATAKGVGGNRAGKEAILNEAKKSIYLFATNTKRTSKTSFFNPTPFQLEQANADLEKLNFYNK